MLQPLWIVEKPALKELDDVIASLLFVEALSTLSNVTKRPWHCNKQQQERDRVPRTEI